ncbi:MAG: extensin family protein [Myxococcota bacterium]
MLTLHGLLALLLFSTNAADGRVPIPEGLDEAPWEHAYVDQCAEKLDEAGIDYAWIHSTEMKRLPAPRKARGDEPEIVDFYCYVPQALQYIDGPTRTDWSGYLYVNCRMALAIARFEEIAQEVAEEVFGPDAWISYIQQYGTYNCRRLRKFPWFQSQHSFGNGIDIARFTIQGYGRVWIEEHWDPSYPAQRKGSRFLRRLAERLREEHVFTNVLTPEFDAGHDNHFHLDLAPPELDLRPFELPIALLPIPRATPDADEGETTAAK